MTPLNSTPLPTKAIMSSVPSFVRADSAAVSDSTFGSCLSWPHIPDPPNLPRHSIALSTTVSAQPFIRTNKHCHRSDDLATNMPFAAETRGSYVEGNY